MQPGTNAYRGHAVSYSLFAMGQWHREPSAPSYGCFDRQYWGWKKKDLPDAALQQAIALVLRLADHTGETGSLPPLLDAYVAFMRRIQRADGSFDQIYPYEKAPGVVHDILSSLILLWRSPLLSQPSRLDLEGVMARAVKYALQSDEKHGEIANHFAHYAWELTHYGETFGNSAALAGGRRYLDRTLALFNDREGWFREYDGADAGYQSRCVAFLSRVAELTGDEQLWPVLGQAGGFLGRMAMPDGSFHPMLGVRSTALTYVSGFERLALRFPELAWLADRVHAAWAAGRALTPGLLDFENGLRIADDAFDAADLRARRLAPGDRGRMAADDAPGAFDLPDAGLSCRHVDTGVAARTIHVATRLGGVVVVHDCRPGHESGLSFEDSGYLVELADSSRWVMRHAGSGDGMSVGDSEISLEARFVRALHEDMSPSQLLLLRSLNLTVLRSQFVGDLFKKLVVRRLISGRRHLPLSCRRRISIEAGRVVVEDIFVVPASLAGRLKGARLLRCRRAIANHMASSRYFQPQEMELRQPWTEEVPAEVVDGLTLRREVPAAAAAARASSI